MNQVLMKGVAKKDAYAGAGKTGVWWVVDVQPEGESSSFTVWHFGDAPPPRAGDVVDLVGRLGWNKDRDGNWSVRVVAAEVTVTAARSRNGSTNGRRVGAGPRQIPKGGGMQQPRRTEAEHEDDIHF